MTLLAEQRGERLPSKPRADDDDIVVHVSRFLSLDRSHVKRGPVISGRNSKSTAGPISGLNACHTCCLARCIDPISFLAKRHIALGAEYRQHGTGS